MDLIVVFLYILIVFITAYFASSSKKKSSFEEQYLAGKSLNFWESFCSIVATEVSALTFLALPAYSFAKDFSFIHIYIGAVFGRLIIAWIEVPLIYNKGLTLYEIITSSRNSTLGARRLLSLIYIISKILGVGVRLYAGSILVSEFFGISGTLAIIVTGVITFIYTTIGGLKAVVRTDMLQGILFVSGAIIAHSLIPELMGRPWTELMWEAKAAGKLNLINFSDLSTFFVGVIGGILFDIGTHGMDQDYLQRLMGAKSLKTAKKAIFYSSFLSIGIGLLFLSIGTLLWSFYQQHVLPPELKTDQVFSYFIMNEFSPIVRGLMMAGVLAATMSTLDSTINALSSCLSNDIFLRTKFAKMKKVFFIDGLVISCSLVAVAFVASSYDGILIIGLKIASWVGGGLIGLFATQTLLKGNWRALNAYIVALSFLVSVVFVYINTFIYLGPWQFNVYWGLVGSLIVQYLVRSKKLI
jgi:SSS family transporter